MTLAPFFLGLLRRFGIIRLGPIYAVTRQDDVREVFGTDVAFGVVYQPNLMVLTDNQPFFLGLSQTPQYKAQLAARRRVFLPADLAPLGDRAEALAAAAVAAANGQIEVVSLIRQVTFGLMAPYLGIPESARGRLDVWATRLFEFQFTGTPQDTELRAEVDKIAPAFRAHIDAEIDRRHAVASSQDDVLGRCLRLQAQGEPGYSDIEIRTALLCMIVGGPPQPPMVVPQAMEQLLRRPAALAAAHGAAQGNDALLHDIVLEAMRFDPLASALPRIALADRRVAEGTRRQTVIPRGATVLVSFAAAMMDSSRVANPQVFTPGRPACDYIHFGYGLHECFGRYLNQAVLHRMLKPLLRRPNLRRAGGAQGHLLKNGIFADRLVVLYD